MISYSAATSVSYTINYLSSGSHTVRVRATKSSNDVDGYSSVVTVDLSPPTVTLSLSNVTKNSIKINGSANANCNIWQYRYKSSGSWSSWSTFSSTNGTSASFTLTGLSYGTEYTIQIRARKATNNLYAESSTATATTIGGTLLNSIADFALDPASPQCTINVTVQGSGFYHRLYIYNEAGTQLHVVEFATTWTAETANKTFAVPAQTRSTMLNTFPNAKTCKFKGQLKTYGDSGFTDLIGSSVMREFTCSTSEAVSKPTFTTFTYEDTESETVDITGNDQVLIQSYSDLEVTVTAGTAKNGATISGYSLSIGDVSLSFTGTTVDAGAVGSSGQLTLTVTCTDSRGYSTSVSTVVTVLPYTKPRFNTYALRRRNEVDTLVQLSFTGAVSSIQVGGVEKNSVVQVKFKYKKTSEPDSSYIEQDLTSALTVSGLTFSYNNQQLFDLDAMTSYNFVFYVYDELGDISVYILEDILNQGTPIIALRKRTSLNNRPRVGINNPTPVYELDVHGDIAMHDLIVQGFVAELNEESLSLLKSGGIYAQSDSSKASTLRSYPVNAGVGLLEVLPSAGGTVIQRYTLFDMTAVYIRCCINSSWSSWKSHSLS